MSFRTQRKTYRTLRNVLEDRRDLDYNVPETNYSTCGWSNVGSDEPIASGNIPMGEVYRARDTRLEREVALKVLPAEVASEPERLKRFEKEARSSDHLRRPFRS